jgi:hypothetical protein
MGGLWDGLFVTSRIVVGIGTLGLSELTVRAISTCVVQMGGAPNGRRVQAVRPPAGPQPEELDQAVEAVTEALAELQEDAPPAAEAIAEAPAAPQAEEPAAPQAEEPAVSPEERLKDRFRERKVKTAISARKLLARIAEARGQLGEDERQHLSAHWLDGGDLALLTIFRHAKILSMKPDKREQVYATEFAKNARPYIDAELEAAGMRRAGNARAYDALRKTREEELEVMRRGAALRLQDPAERIRVQKFLEATKGRKLGFEDARAALRLAPGAEDRLALAQLAVGRLFAREGLTDEDVALIDAFFPG